MATPRVIVIVGRPNVGKSTLFNALTRKRDALVADLPGVTRDRHYGSATSGEHTFLVVDTGGIEGANDAIIDPLVERQVYRAVEEADWVLLLVDAKTGLLPLDQGIAEYLRQHNIPVTIVVNKIDRDIAWEATADFHQLGLGDPIGIAAKTGRGITPLIDHIWSQAGWPIEVPSEPEETLVNGPRVAIVGRPNVGKSTLVNRLLGEERVVVSDIPGTTRDSIFIPFTRRDKPYTLIDTAGVRRRAKIEDPVEKFSVIKTLQAIETAHVVLFLIDAQHGLVEQDLKLLGFVVEQGKGL